MENNSNSNAAIDEPIWEQTLVEERPYVILDSIPLFVKELLAGGTAGGVAKTAVAPLERVKILFQTKQDPFLKSGIYKSLGIILKTEGFQGFFKGNGASVARVVPYAALHFMTYEQYRRWILAWSEGSQHTKGPTVDLVAGSLAGATAVIFTYPLDLIRTQLAYQVSGLSKTPSLNPPYKGIFDAFSRISKNFGVRGLYRGIGPTIWGILPYAGLKFYIYETLKGSLPSDRAPLVAEKLTCGAIAGLTGQTLTYPLDVVRRQMQVELEASGTKPNRSLESRGTAASLVHIVRTQGWRQLYAGLSINYLKVVPSVAVGFAVYDGMKDWLRVPVRK